MKTPLLPIISCVMSITAAMAAPGTDDDLFGQIAKQQVGLRYASQMETPGPLPLPENTLGWNGCGIIQPIEKIDTPEKLKAALLGQREKMKPFLQSLHPALREERIVLPVKKMQFRMETDADKADFLHTASGQGKWTEVSIPHYTGPGERAVCWYRTTFTVSEAMKTKERLIAHFGGVSYFAEVYINGHFIGDHQGYFAAFDLDFTPYAKSGENVLLVKVRNSSRMTIGSTETNETSNRKVNIPRTFGDKVESSNSPGWDDPHTGWNGTPNGFGICQGVSIETRSNLYINDIFPQPVMAQKAVDLNIEVENPSEANGEARLRVSVFGRNFHETVTTDLTNDCKVAGTRPIYHIMVPIANPRVWTLDEPWLYQAQVQLLDASGKVLDTAEKHFGMRSFEMKEDSKPCGRMFLNGQEIRLRGANEMGNFQLDVLRGNREQLIDDMLLAKITRLNFLRCTQTIMPPEFYDCCDQLGFMNQSDLPLFSKISHKQVPETLRQAAEMERAVRSHPSNVLVTFFNEPDGGDGTGGYAFALNRTQVDQFMEAARTVVLLQNPDQTIKLVDGDYNPPSNGLPDNHCYSGWYGNHGVSQEKLYAGYWMPVRKGWMYGCGEFGSEGLDSIQIMEKYYPREWLTTDPDGSWMPDKIEGSQTWNKHKEWYKTPRTMAEWVEASQQHQADVTRLKIEAFRRMTRMNTCAIHLFIDAWPNGWLKTIMDVERQPKKAWFAYYDGLAPLAVQVRSEGMKNKFVSGEPANVELWVCNDSALTPECELRYQLEMGGKVIRSGKANAKVPTVSEGAFCQGLLPIQAPAVTTPTPMQLRVNLVRKSDGSAVDQYVFTAEALPGK